MPMDIGAYLEAIRDVHKTGVASEHSYRPALRDLFASIDPAIDVVNEPKKIEVGAPDFIFQHDGVARGWCEHKDIDKDIIKPKGYSKEQKERYRDGLPNLIYTNGLDFEFLRDGEQVALITIADFAPGLPGNSDEFERLETHLREFAATKPISIKSARRLAELMAGKAKLIKDVLANVLKDDAELRSDLAGQFKSFKANLLPNLTTDEFADIYAETVTYGMFAARYHDQTPKTFSRQEALELLPKSNPFLRSLFQFVAGYDLDERIAWIVDDLAEVLRASNPHDLFKDFGKFTARNDPFIHFYEDFLAAYNPKKRKSRGVWYTPEPVVDFIVRAVDDVLKSEFGLADGLADTSKVTVDWDTGLTGKKGEALTEKREVHRVQILDPATGTGTFLAKATQLISDRVKGVAPGAWSDYVERDLLPRLHGFELLMASYAMCHMKLDMQLTESGYVPGKNPPRLSVWLTNALEPAERVKQDLFWKPLAKEAEGAADVKRQTPIMCVIGNPPYSGESANKGDHIMNLMDAYKKEPGGKERLKERNPKWINDDYVKFIRMSEDMIAQNPSGGVLGFITNHGYLDNPTFRGMRWHLLKTFDKIWVLDLHGNAKKKEVSPDGSPDQNVFDIQQGVALIVAVRKGEGSEKLAKVCHGDLWGSRKAKSESLAGTTAIELSRNLLPNRSPEFPLVNRNFVALKRYERGFEIDGIFVELSTGILTARDSLTVDFDRKQLESRVSDFQKLEASQLREKYRLGKDSRDWKVQYAQRDLIENSSTENYRLLDYRPFDSRWTFFTGNNRGFHTNPRYDVMRHLNLGANLGVGFTRTIEGGRSFADIGVFQRPITHHTLSMKEVNSLAPLYLYPDEDAEQGDAFAATERTLNLDPKLYAAICEKAGIDPADTDMARGEDSDFRTATGDDRPSEVKVFDYIYGVLHSPDYRETFAEFLKIDFPRIPYPASAQVFAHVSEKGEALRRLHLMEAGAIGDAPFPFVGEVEDDEDRNAVASGYPKREDGHVWINKHQYFQNVPEIAWSFYIGGYQPAQKWLKDRKGRVLEFADLQHYQRIIKILLETDRIMKEIELPLDG